jgi:hypothetical protein
MGTKLRPALDQLMAKVVLEPQRPTDHLRDKGVSKRLGFLTFLLLRLVRCRFPSVRGFDGGCGWYSFDLSRQSMAGKIR